MSHFYPVTLELEDVASVAVFLLTVELNYLKARNYTEARRTFAIASKLAAITESPFLVEYVAGAGAERAQFYPAQAEEVRA